MNDGFFFLNSQHNIEFMTQNSLVLLVDDVPQNIQLLGNILKKEGYSFALTSSGIETTELLKNTTPDIILLDIMLPGENGFSICKRIKKQPHLADIPIIFLSARHDIKDKIKAFEQGAVDYITKPFEEIEVIKRVKNHLQAKLDRDKIRKYNSELEKIVEQRTKELIKKERESILAQFMQGIIHNLRGPITSVANAMEIINMMKTNLPDIQSKDLNHNLLDKSLANIWELNELNKNKLDELLKDLNTMLNRSRHDYSTEVEVCNLNDIVEREINFLKVDLDFKNLVKKDINLCDEKLLLKIVPAELSQIIQNLIQNAMDAMFDQTEKVIKITTGIVNKMAFFNITDNGPGVPENIVSIIFDPFFTTKPINPTEIKGRPIGTGIGLRFCKSTIESYGGSISVDKCSEGGASFTIKIPLDTSS